MKHGSAVKMTLALLDNYTNYDCIRPSNRAARRGSGGVTVFVKDEIVNKNIVKRIYDDMSECVVLLLCGNLFEGINDIIFFYVCGS